MNSATSRVPLEVSRSCDRRFSSQAPCAHETQLRQLNSMAPPSLPLSAPPPPPAAHYQPRPPPYHRPWQVEYRQPTHPQHPAQPAPGQALNAGSGAPQHHPSPADFPRQSPPSHEQHKSSEYHWYNHRGRQRQDDATAPFPGDSWDQQRPPTTPAHPGHYPPGMQPHPSAYHTEHTAQHSYGTPNGVPHGLPPPPPPYYHEPPPIAENHQGHSPPPPEHMYPNQSYGPASSSVRMDNVKRKHMRATQVRKVLL